MTSKNISSLIYQKLSLRVDGMSINELVVACNLQEREALLSINELEKRGLVIRSDQLIRAIPWWNEDHLEVFLNIPLVSPDVFQQYCDELDSFCERLRSEGFQALRPYTHETAFEIILGVTAGFALSEFAKGFLNELGKKLAGFVGKAVKRHQGEGVTEVEIKGIRHSINGVIFAFSVKGSDEETVLKRFANLQESIEEMCHNMEKKDSILVNSDGWEILLIKEIPASNKSIESNLMHKLKIILKAELSELNYPYEGDHRKAIIPIDADLVLKIAQELAEALIYLGAIGGGLITIKKVLHKVKSTFNPNKNTRTIESVLLFLIKQFEESGSGATVNELSSAIHRSKSSIRKALHTLQSKGLAHKTQNRFAGSYVWYYTRPKAFMQNEMEGSK